MRIITLVAAVAVSTSAFAQHSNKPAAPASGADAAAMKDPVSASLKFNYERIKKFITAAADEMPPESYSFKPTPEVRSFGQLIGHLADAQVMFCSAAKKDTAAPKKNVEKTMTDKAALKKALADAFAYCDAVYAAATDATMAQPVQLFGQNMPKFAALDINVSHDNEHYGNIVTYLRIKKLVPPSSKE